MEHNQLCYTQIELRIILGAFANPRKATVTFVMSVCRYACTNSFPSGRICITFDTGSSCCSLSRKSYLFNIGRK